MFKPKSISDAAIKGTGATLLGLGGVVFGYVAGGIFTAIGIYTETIPWQAILTALGGAAGVIFGWLLNEE